MMDVQQLIPSILKDSYGITDSLEVDKMSALSKSVKALENIKETDSKK